MHPHRSPALRRTRQAALAVAMLVLVACGSDDAGSAPEPATPLPTAPAPSDSTPPGPAPTITTPPVTTPPADPAGGTRPAAISPAEALTFEEPMPLVVQGWLHVSGDTWRLCGAVLESFPPQCSEQDAVVIANPEDIPEADLASLQEASGVRWSEESVVYAGERRGDAGFQITGPADDPDLIGGDAAAGDGSEPELLTPAG